MKAPVAIIGAGPVGLCLALRLAALGTRSMLLEATNERARDLRASTFHPPTLEMLDTLCLAEPLIARGLVTRDWQIRIHETGERALFDLAAIKADTRYPYRLQCEQSVLCSLAEEMVRKHPLIDLQRGFAVSAVEDGAHGMLVRARSGAEVCADWLVGADGSRSIVREACGFDFEGFTYPETTILATTPFPFHEHIEGLSNVNYCWSDHGTFSLLRLPDIWRCSLYADAGETIEQALQPDSIEGKLQRIVPCSQPYEVIEIRPYRIHNRIVRSYRRGRVLLAGDAAHLNSPSGGMGMNGGIHDAFALAEALHRVIGGDSDSLLDSYARRRKAVAEEQILKQAHRNRTRMQQRDPDTRREELARLQAICTDRAALRDYLLASSMIAGLRQAEAMT